MKPSIAMLLLVLAPLADRTNGQQLRREDTTSNEVNGPRNSHRMLDGDSTVTNQDGKDFRILTGDTPTLRLVQDNRQGWGDWEWDVGGNESNFFIRDATNSNTLPFRIDNGAPNNSFYITDSGMIVVNGFAPHENTGTRLFVNDGNLAVDGTIESPTISELQTANTELENRIQRLEDQVQQLLNQR